MSARGCLLSSRSLFAQCGETDRFLEKDSNANNSHDMEQTSIEQHLGLSENLMHIVYQVCQVNMITDTFFCIGYKLVISSPL